MPKRRCFSEFLAESIRRLSVYFVRAQATRSQYREVAASPWITRTARPLPHIIHYEQVSFFQPPTFTIRTRLRCARRWQSASMVLIGYPLRPIAFKTSTISPLSLPWLRYRELRRYIDFSDTVLLIGPLFSFVIHVSYLSFLLSFLSNFRTSPSF